MPGIGFGSGIERILLAANAPEEEAKLDVYFVTLAPEARLTAFALAASLRAEGLACELDYAGHSAKGQFKQADRSGVHFAIIIGDEELAQGSCKLRDMTSGEERFVSVADGPGELLRTLKA